MNQFIESKDILKTNETITESDPFFMTDPTIIWSKSRLFEFFPNDLMTVDEKINAIFRFSLYFSILYYLYSQKKESFLPIIFAIILGIGHINGCLSDFNKNNQKQPYSPLEMDNNDINDSDNSYHPFISPNILPVDPNKVRKSTKDNPFVNQLLWSPDQLQDPDDVNTPANQKLIRQNYLDGDRRVNYDDIYQKNDGFNRFHHVPKLDFGKMAKFQHSNLKSCRSDPQQCQVPDGGDPKRNHVRFSEIEEQVMNNQFEQIKPVFREY